MATRYLSLVATAALTFATPGHAAEIKVLSTNALKTVLEDLGPKFEQSSGLQARHDLGHRRAAESSSREGRGV
jgi:ABC-type molybdate transport system substrate-binding protein